MNQALNMASWFNLSLRLFSLMIATISIVILFFVSGLGYLSSIFSQLASDNFTVSSESMKFTFLIVSILILIASALILFLSYKFLSFAFNKNPTAIIEDNGIRYPANAFQPESFLEWNNIKNFKRMKLGPIKGGILITAKDPTKTWSKNLFIMQIFTWVFRIVSFGLWRGELHLNKFGLGSFKEFSTDELERMLHEVTNMSLPQKNAPVSWKNIDHSNNRQTVLLSVTLPILAYAAGFASNHYFYLWNEEANTTRIIRHFAHQGNPDAQTKLGWRYSTATGVGGYRHHQEAVYWYKKAAEQGYAKSQYNLGNAYKSGRGIKRNYDKAAYWLSLAVEQNQPNAKSALATLYLRGQGIERSYSKALDLYKEAVADGISYANNNLGYMYEKGEGVPISTEKAIEYYKKAAVDNNKYAIKALKRLGET